MTTPTCAAALLLVTGLTGCWVSDDTPPIGTKGTCNNNGMCEVEKGEDCNDCVADCPCCRAIQFTAENDVQSPEKALGDGDGQSATLGPNATIQLEVGREILDQEGADFLLLGKVTSESSVGLSQTGCPINSPTGSGYRVEVSLGASGPWHLIGFWTKVTTPATAGQGMPFDLTCATSGVGASVRWVRLTPLGTNSAAQLDALVASSCLE